MKYYNKYEAKAIVPLLKSQLKYIRANIYFVINYKSLYVSTLFITLQITVSTLISNTPYSIYVARM